MAWENQRQDVKMRASGDAGVGVIDGLVVRDPGSATLTTTIEGGIILLKPSTTGTGVTSNDYVIQDTSKTFTASKDTYVYVNASGALAYDELANGATKPTTAAIEALGGVGSQIIAKVVTDGTRVTAGGVTDLRQLAGVTLERDTIAGLSFVTATQGATYWVPPGTVDIYGYRAVVTAALGGTDTGTITAALGLNDVYTNQVGGVITGAISAAVATRYSAYVTGVRRLPAGQSLRLTTAKTTTGGAMMLQILYARA